MTDVLVTLQSINAGNIASFNSNVDESHKVINDKKVSNITLRLEDPEGNLKFCPDPIYYELEFKFNKAQQS